MSFTLFHEIPDIRLAQLDSLAHGCYQRELLGGSESWSGSTLRGDARKWSGPYARSRDSFLRRIQQAGFSIDWIKGRHGQRVLVISTRPLTISERTLLTEIERSNCHV